MSGNELSEVSALRARIEDLEQQLKDANLGVRWEADLCQQALDSRAEMERELAKSQKDADRWRHQKANKDNYVPMFERAGQLGFECPESPNAEEFRAWDQALFGRCCGTMQPAWHLYKEGSPKNFVKAFEMGWLECMAYLHG